MIEEAHVVAYGRPAADALVDVVRAAKGDRPLAPVTVVVGSNFAGLAARRLLGSGILGAHGPQGTVGIANVGFVTPFRLAEQLAADRLLDRRPLTNPALGAAVRRVLARDPGPYHAVRDHVATQSALASLYGELSNISPAARERVRTDGGANGALAVRYHDAIADVLAGFHGEADLARAATDHPELRARLAPLGHIVWYLPTPVTTPMAELLGAVFANAPATVLIGVTGVESADEAVLDTCRRAGVDVPSPAPVTPATAAHIVSVTDADEEVRTVVRRIAELAEQGTPLDRIGVFHPVPQPYVGMLEQQLAAAGIPANGPSRRRLGDSVAGRTLLGALELPSGRGRRDHVKALVAGAPLRHGDGAATPAAWETVSRQAGVIAGLRDWQGKLEAFERGRERRLAEMPVPPSEAQVTATRRLVDDSRRLRSFVDDLAQHLGAVDAASGWAATCAAAATLLDRLLGPASRHALWPDGEQAAFDQVHLALTRLATLDELEPAPTTAVFRQALTAELDVGMGRNGRFGDGVLYAPLASAVGHDLDAVFILGCAEGLCPAGRRDDAMLAEQARRAADGELEVRADRLHGQHRQFLAALAAAPASARVLTFPRSDLRGNRRSLPSRWLLDSATALADRTVHSTAFASLAQQGLHGVEVIASHAGGIVGAPVFASVDERDLADVARWTARGGDPVAHPATLPVRRGLDAQLARRSPAFTEWDGNLAGAPVAGPSTEHAWSPTRLQHWAECGFKYYLGHVLGLSDRDEPERILDLDPLDRGRGVHEVLERFMAEAIERGAPDPDQPWSAADHERIRAIATEVFAEYEFGGRTGRALHWRLTNADLLDSLDDFLLDDDAHRALTRSRPEFVEYPFGDGTAPPALVELPDGRTLRFRGVADRIDRVDDRRVVVSDYKTGKGTQYKGLGDDDPVRGGTLLQLGLYAKAVSQHLGVTDVDSHYWIVNPDPKLRQRHGYPWTDERDRRLVDVVTAIVDGIEAGAFPAVPGEWSIFRNTHENCTYCEFDAVCVRDRGEQAAAKADAPEVAVRLPLEWTAS
ncbi:MAG: PD-(D/E)XK nuclease family protein [Acidimicrobiales bacterium]